MKTWALTVSLWSLVVVLAASEGSEYLYKDDKDAGAVIEHTAKNDFEASKKPRLVEFYSPYCGGCRNFKPKYITMAEEITAKYADVEVYAVSCAPFKEICTKHKIKGYPALYAFPAGATEGTYLQKSSMGGSYEITAIADTLKVTKDSSSTKSTKTKKSLTSSKMTSTSKVFDDSKDAEVVNKKSVAANKDDSEETVTSKKTSTKKTLKKSIVSKKDKDESTDKEFSKEEEDASTDKNLAIKNKRQLADDKEEDEDKKEEEDEDKKEEDEDKKEEEDGDNKKDSEEETTESDEEKSMASAKKAVGKTLMKKASIVEKEEEDEEDDKDEKKSDDKEDVKGDESDKDEDEKSDDKDEKSADKEDAVEKSADKEDAVEKSNDKEGAVEKSDDKEDAVEKSDDKEDAVEKSDDKDEEKSDDKNEKDENSSDKEDEDEKSNDKDDGGETKNDSSTPFRASAISTAGGVPSRVYTGSNIKPGRIPSAGATKAGVKERDMDKWKTIMEQRKKMLQTKGPKMNFLRPLVSNKKSTGPGGKVNLSTPGKTGTTQLMRANTPGTLEFDERKKQIIARIEMAKKKHSFYLLGTRSKPSTTLVKREMLPFKKEPKKAGLMRRGMEKVPMVKRMFKMSPEEELILDASLSFITGLKHGLFMSSDSLTDKKKDALKSWLELLSVSLPPEWGLHALIDDLSKNVDFVAKNNENLQKILARHPSPRKLWSKSCDTKGMGGFSCGMWKLFHIVSLGVAEHKGGSNLIESGLSHVGTRTFSPFDAAGVFREYMAHFYGCDDCRKHFLEKYDSCAFRRCDRLTDSASSASPDDWKQLALWMWEVHNDVNIRVNNKKVDRIQKKLNSKHLQGAQTLKLGENLEAEIKVLFPTLDDCVVCFDESGKWNEDSVFEYLERTYWDAPDAKFDRLLTARNVEGEDASGGGFIWIMMIITLCIVVSLRRHVNNLSFKNNFKVASVMSVGNKIGDVVAGKQRTA